MRVTLIALAVLGVSSLATLIYAYFAAPRGYEDESGFHKDPQTPRGLAATIHWLHHPAAKRKTERAA